MLLTPLNKLRPVYPNKSLPKDLKQVNISADPLQTVRLPKKLGIYHRKDQRLIGTVGIHRICNLHLQGSFGIAIGETKYWNYGYGKQALHTMLDWSFKVRGLRTITLCVLGNNKRARKCYEKCGFKPAGVIPQSVFKRGKWIDKHIMVIQSPLIKQ